MDKVRFFNGFSGPLGTLDDDLGEIERLAGLRPLDATARARLYEIYQRIGTLLSEQRQRVGS